MKIKSTILILLAGVLWGSMGVFVHQLVDVLGFTSLQSSVLRIVSATVILFLFLLIYDRRLLKIKLRDIPLLFACGIFSILLMTIFYFGSISSDTSMSISAVLLYTAPFIVMLLSFIFFGEKITIQKIISLIIAFIGCLLVSVTEPAQSTSAGIILGLLSGVAYALYSIFGTMALKKHHPYTITFYSFLFSAVGCIFVAIFTDLPATAATVNDLSYFNICVLLTGLVTAVLPFLFYTKGLSGTTPAKASIMAYAEPMSACVFGYFLGEKMTPVMILGLLLTLSSIVFLNINIPFLSGKSGDKKHD